MKVIISLLSILIFSLLILTYVKISAPVFKKFEYSEKEINLSKLKSNDDLKIVSFNYKALPARVLYEKIDFRKFKTVILYKVTIKNNDKFAIFNIIEILKNKEVAYSMIKQKTTEIYVIFRNLKEAEDILKLFKFYNFPVKLQKIFKRI
jgi:hypothetical protein